jgi:CPA2 family monovalent cation:H+ antiporter-2
MNIVVAVATLSICLNPLVFGSLAPIDRWIRKHPRLVDILEREAPDDLPDGNEALGLLDHVVIVGFGRVGATIAKALDEALVSYVVVEKDHEIISQLKSRGIGTVLGDASRPGVLSHTGLKAAKLLIIASPDSLQTVEMVRSARHLNPDIKICARTHDFGQIEELRQLGVNKVTMGEVEMALEMSRYALEYCRMNSNEVWRVIERLRYATEQ